MTRRERELQLAGMLAGVFLIFFLILVVQALGAILMKRLPILAACAAAAVLLSGCAGLGNFLTEPQAPNSPGIAILKHLELCKRVYTGALGVGVTGSFTIECPAATPEQLAAMARAGVEVGGIVGEPTP